MNQLTEELRAKAEIYHGDELCQAKSRELLREILLPEGLLPLQDVEETGYVRETGFVWLKQKKKTTHCFEKIGKQVSYDTEVTAFVEARRIKKLTGVKAKELLIWVTLCEINIDPATASKLNFKTPTGLSRAYPVSAFELEDEPKKAPADDAAVPVPAPAAALPQGVKEV